MSRRRHLSIVAAFGLFSFAQAGTVLYVDDDAPLNGDGLTWSTAYRFLQDALANALAGDEIRVAQGTYKPDEDEGGNVTPGDRLASFQLINGVALMGGFAGVGAADPDARDPDTFPSVLSGDIVGDDDDFLGSCCSPHGTPGCISEECQAAVCEELPSCCETAWDLLCAAMALSPINPECNPVTDCPEIENNVIVVTGSFTDPTAVLDGFTITRGVPGLFVREGAPTIERCAIVDNSNRGLIALLAQSTIAECTFSGNVGSGLRTLSSSLMVTDCTFAGNASYRGAGADLYGVTTISGCTFSGNRAMSGGGMILDGGTVIDCTFLGNAASWFGGGLIMDGNTKVIGCIFENNTASLYGGGLRVHPDEPEQTYIVNSLFLGNSAEGGGGAYIWGKASPFINCTFSNNTAAIGGGLGGGSAILINCVLWGNIPDEFEVDGYIHTVAYSDVQGGFPGVGNIDADPLWVDPGGGDYRLRPGSPCIDAGHSQSLVGTTYRDLPCDLPDLDRDGDTIELIPHDCDGRSRFADDPATPDTGCAAGPVVDMGAYEFGAVATGPRVLYADLDGDGAVTVSDLLIVLAEWGPCNSACCVADIGTIVADQNPCRQFNVPDGEVGLAELYTILGFWGL